MVNLPVWLQSPISAGFISGLIFGVIFIVIPVVKAGKARFDEVMEEEMAKSRRRQIRMRKFRKLQL